MSRNIKIYKANGLNTPEVENLCEVIYKANEKIGDFQVAFKHIF